MNIICFKCTPTLQLCCLIHIPCIHSSHHSNGCAMYQRLTLLQNITQRTTNSCNFAVRLESQRCTHSIAQWLRHVTGTHHHVTSLTHVPWTHSSHHYMDHDTYLPKHLPFTTTMDLTCHRDTNILQLDRMIHALGHTHHSTTMTVLRVLLTT